MALFITGSLAALAGVFAANAALRRLYVTPDTVGPRPGVEQETETSRR